VVQCWDDGVVDDLRLTELLRKYGAKATFNINPGLHQSERTKHFVHQGKDVIRLGWGEMLEAYRGFTIGNHSMSHPPLTGLSAEEAHREIADARSKLREYFGQPILGFAYPFGAWNKDVMKLLRDTGHVYARTVQNVETAFPPEDPMAFHPNCHFLADDFWDRLAKAKHTGVFYFWGHSYELMDETMWAEFEATIQRISEDPGCRWGELTDLFPERSMDPSPCGGG